MQTNLDDKIFSIQLKGALDGVSSDDLFRYLESQLEKGYIRFLFNFSHVEFITSNGISTLLKIQKRISKETGLSFVFYGLCEEVENVLTLLGLNQKLPIRKTLTEAEAYLKSQVSIPRIQKEDLARPLRFSEPGSEKIKFYYSGNPKEAAKRPRTFEPDPVSQLESISEETTKVEKTLPIPAENRSMEMILEEKIHLLRNEIKETLSNEFDKRFTTLNNLAPDEIDPNRIPNYIQPKSKQTSENFEKIFPCEACNARLRVTRAGKHQCPTCKTEVYVSNTGSTRFLEKLHP